MKGRRILKCAGILAGAAVLAAGGYLMWCRSLTDSVIWMPYTVNGVSLKGMTRREAEKALKEQFQKEYGDIEQTVRLAGREYYVKVFPVLDIDPGEVIDEAYETGHGAWYERGQEWLKSRRQEEIIREVMPYAAYPEKLSDAILDTGIQDVNTVTESVCTQTEKSLIIRKGKKGVRADIDRLSENMSAFLEQGRPEAEIECPVVEVFPREIDLQPYFDEIHTEAVDAYVDKEDDYKVTKSREGRTFDLEKAKKKLAEAKDGEEIVVDFETINPEVTTEELKNKKYRDVLGSYTTYGAGTKDRITNLTLAAKACDGITLMPGEVFSYNETLGERTEKNGYRTATVYINGKEAQGIGGGICQVSSTLFAAALYADLEIVQRKNHSATVGYLPMGMDAAVSWGGPDLKFRNNTDDPVRLSVTYEKGRINAEIQGIKKSSDAVKITTERLDELTVKTFRSHYDKTGKLLDTEEVAYSKYKAIHGGE